jgi:4'-phosphopantetheinyl transferase
MVFAPGIYGAPAYNIGIDVMKVRVPGRDTFASFVNTVRDQVNRIPSPELIIFSEHSRHQLTPLEHCCLFKEGISQDEGLRRFFWMWTLKEAYTKALGLGLGFDFHRVEFDVEENVVRVDKEILAGWRFSKFVLNDGEDFYEGVVAEYLGGTQIEVIPESASQPWFISHDAVPFVEKAIQNLAEVEELSSRSAVAVS